MIIRRHYSPSQTEISRIADDVLLKHAGPGKLRRGAGVDRSTWKELSSLGWMETLRADALGGHGLPLADVAVLAERAGYHLLAGPLIDTIIASALWQGAGPNSDEWSRIALAPCTRAGTDAGGVSSRDGQLHGSLPYVPYGSQCQYVLVACESENGPQVVVVDVTGDGVDVASLQSSDRAIAPASMLFNGAPILDVVTSEGVGMTAVARMSALAGLMNSAKCLGLADRVLEIARDHARTRVQFGRTIGSFQAVQHRLADMTVSVTTLLALVSSGVGNADLTDVDPKATEVLHAYASATVRDVVESAMQVLGGIAFTAEHDLHLYLKHALTLAALDGTPSRLYASIGERLVAPPLTYGSDT